MSAKVYVGNLAYATSWQRLKDHFRQAGEVVHADVMQERGRSKGCGLVTMSSAQEAQVAIDTLNETELDGRVIFVREDREVAVGGLPAPGTRTSAAPSSTKLGGGLPAPIAPRTGVVGSKVYVGNLSYETSWQRLKDHFRQAGEVVHADVMQQEHGRSKGCGLVTMSSAREAQIAIETLNETELDGRIIFVREDREEAVGGLPAPGTRTSAAAITAAVGGLPAPRSAAPAYPRVAGNSAAAAAAMAPANTRLYVGNLSYETSWQRLKDHFRQAGEVVHADVMQQEQGRSKGCGLVTMSSEQEAQVAIDTLNETELDGRVIFVREDREAAVHPAVGAAPRRMPPAAMPQAPRAAQGATQGCQLYVGNLPWGTSWQELKNHFRVAGSVTHADVPQDANGRSRGFGTVLFATTREAAKAIQLFNESDFNGRTIEVRPDQYC